MCRKIRQKGMADNGLDEQVETIHLNQIYIIICNKFSSTVILIYLVDGKWRYIRSCAWMSDPLKMARRGDERFCLIRQGTWDIHIEYCECYSKDGCNSSTKVFANAALLGLFLVVGWLLALASSNSLLR